MLGDTDGAFLGHARHSRGGGWMTCAEARAHSLGPAGFVSSSCSREGCGRRPQDSEMLPGDGSRAALGPKGVCALGCTSVCRLLPGWAPGRWL